MKESVLLLHGLWMNRYAMHALGHRLREAGYAATSVTYHSMRDSVDDHVAKIEKKTNVKPDGYEDFRRVLERKDIDVIFCATVDHWHTKVSCEAMDAGKHVYV